MAQTRPLLAALAAALLLCSDPAPAAAPDMMGLMLKGHESMMAVRMTGDPDADFALAMREHHIGALQMAQWQLEHGKDPGLKAMARGIIASQKQEIAHFEAFLRQRGVKGFEALPSNAQPASKPAPAAPHHH